MLVDFCILKYKRMVRVSGIDIAGIQNGVQLLLTGGDFRGVSEVVINNVPISPPNVVVVDANHLLVTLPKILAYKPIEDIEVFTDAPDVGQPDKMEMRITGTLRTGIDRLSQMVVMGLLTTPGSDIFDPTFGGGILRIFGEGVDLKDRTATTGMVSVAVDKVAKDIIERQRNRSLAPEDKLVGIRLNSVAVDPQSLRLQAEIEVISAAHKSSVLVTAGGTA